MKREAWISAARFIGIGWVIGGCIAGGFFGGMWIGRELEMSEVFFGLLGIGVGVLVAVYTIYTSYALVRKGQGNDNDEEK